MSDQTIRLRDGRSLGYAEYGDPNGDPLLLFHGWPGSRFTAVSVHPVAARIGIRLISVDRPGFGLSDFQPGRRLLDWPDDVAQLADALGIGRFTALGISGGGPFALACAHKLTERLIRVGVVSGIGPFTVPNATAGMGSSNRAMFWFARWTPWMLQLPLGQLARAARTVPDAFVARMASGATEADRPILARPEVAQSLVADIAEAFRAGTRGAVHEGTLFVRPWGFRLEDIPVEVHLWQGEADQNVPIGMGRHQARALPDCSARFYPGEGHALVYDRIEEILRSLIGR